MKICKNIGKNVSGNALHLCYLRVKTFLVILSNLLQKSLISKKVIQKTEEGTDDLIGNKIVDKITKVLKTSLQSTSETVADETKNIGFDRETPKQKYMSPDKRQLNTNKLRLT